MNLNLLWCFCFPLEVLVSDKGYRTIYKDMQGWHGEKISMYTDNTLQAG